MSAASRSEGLHGTHSRRARARVLVVTMVCTLVIGVPAAGQGPAALPFTSADIAAADSGPWIEDQRKRFLAAEKALQREKEAGAADLLSEKKKRAQIERRREEFKQY